MNVFASGGSKQIEIIWLGIGILAQTVFFMRFLVQWIVSEIKKQSTIPVAFWYLSIIGASGLLAYALHRRDPVFILGQSLGLFVYFRNLVLIFRKPKPENLRTGV